jgi:MoxR-like ATPase
VPYPPPENELAILRLVRGETIGGAGEPPPRISQDAIFTARKEVGEVHVAETVEKYMVDLVIATRDPQRYGSIMTTEVQTDLETLVRLQFEARDFTLLPRQPVQARSCPRLRSWKRQMDGDG